MIEADENVNETITSKEMGFELSSGAVRQQVGKILESTVFARSDRMKRFLHFAVEETLKGRSEALKEYTIAVAVFDKPDSFDPRLDPIVRVEAGRLRSKLREYYEAEGRGDPVRISFRKRSYVPVFDTQASTSVATSATAVPMTDRSTAPIHTLPSPALTTGQFASLAVLPFADLSAKRDQEYFCEGITEEIVNALSRLEGLQIVSRTSAMRFKDEARDIRQIGMELNVQAVLEGSVRRAGKRVRISVQLINVTDGYLLWSDVYELEMDNIFEVQEQISQAVVRALRIRLAEATGNGLVQYGTSDVKAYQLYLQGRHWWNKRTAEGFRKAVRYFEQAVLQDSVYALAYSGLADCYTSLVWLGVLSPTAGWPKATEMAHLALETDHTVGQAHASLGCIESLCHWNWARAENEFKQAIELNPRYADAHHYYAVYCLAPQLRLEEALLEMKLSCDLEPTSPVMRTDLGWVLYCMRRNDAALEQFRESLSLDPLAYFTYWRMGFALEQEGRLEEGLEAFQKAVELSHGAPLAVAATGHCYGLLGRKNDARHQLDELARMSKRRYVPDFDVALVYAGLGESDSVLEGLVRACSVRSSRLAYLKVDPALDRFRADPRFVDLLKNLSLAG